MTAGGWGLPTPCDEWTVRDVVQHVSGGHAALVRALNQEGSHTPTASPDSYDDPASMCRRWAARAQAAIEEPGALERTARLRLARDRAGSVRGGAAVRCSGP